MLILKALYSHPKFLILSSYHKPLNDELWIIFKKFVLHPIQAFWYNDLINLHFHSFCIAVGKISKIAYQKQ